MYVCIYLYSVCALLYVYMCTYPHVYMVYVYIQNQCEYAQTRTDALSTGMCFLLRGIALIATAYLQDVSPETCANIRFET